ncbi:MAG TPA: ABC transporter permease [Blastocatellia bacterium]|nr:ABC transporter permease [Blastocatellia bacterium]
MLTLIQDLRYGVRMLRKNYGFTVIAVMSLALGIGANTALFSVIDAVLLKKLPVKEPDRLVLFKSLAARGYSYGGYHGSTSPDPATGLVAATSFPYQSFMRLREQESVLSDVFAFAPVGALNVKVDEQADVANGQVVSGNYYENLGAQFVAGRAITEDDDKAGASPVAVISYRYWQRRFDRDLAVLGGQINLNNVAFTIVGITGPEFAGTTQVGFSPDISVPLAMEPQISVERSRLQGAGSWWLRLMGRLKPGATVEQARASLEGAFYQSVTEHRAARQSQAQSQGGRPIPQVDPQDYPRLAVESGSQGEMESRRYYAPQLYLLLGVVGVLLLIACANVANLLLARAASRQKEIAVRLAMGATRFRLVRQLLTESVLLAALGGLLGLLFALWIKDALLGVGYWGGQGMSALDPKLDLRVFGFTFGLSLATGILFGIAPALRATKIDLTPSLKDTGRGSSAVSRSMLSRSLIVAQVAMSLVLLVGAGLIIRTLHNLQNVDAGFSRNNLLLFRVDPNLLGYKGERLANLYKQIFERIEAIPGVSSVTFTRNALLSGSSSGRSVYLPGSAEGSVGETWLHQVRENYLETMEIPLLSGRSLNPQDDSRAPRVAVVNQAFAERCFPGEDPVGKRFGFDPETRTQVEIVGVAKDTKYASLREDIRPTLYLSWLQELGGVGAMTFEVRTSTEPTLLAAAIRQAVREADTNLPLSEVKTQAEQVEQSLRMERLFARLLSFFGLLALLLASVGLYGVMAYSVSQRTQEIGIRMALGAETRDVLKMVIRQGMLLAVAGVALGIGSAIGLTRLMKSMLFGVSATDPATFAAIALLLIAVALVACYIPARRAARVDPMVALRYE